jgi:hypothetical protein
MKRIKIEEVSEGDVLAKSIVLNNGVVLLSKGSILTGSIINQIKKQHIYYVYIENNNSLTDEGADVSYLNGRTMENDLSDIEKRFILVGNIKLMEDIKNIIKKIIIQEYQG